MKIYIFVNGRDGTDVIGTALSEDGEFLAGHLSSNESFLKYDMGLTGTRKHDLYKKHAGDAGYELVWVDDPISHEGVQAAYQAHVARDSDVAE